MKNKPIFGKPSLHEMIFRFCIDDIKPDQENKEASDLVEILKKKQEIGKRLEKYASRTTK